MTTLLNKLTTIRVSWQTNRGFLWHPENEDNGTILKGPTNYLQCSKRNRKTMKQKQSGIKKNRKTWNITEIVEM